MEIGGKTCLITGAASGIGRATAVGAVARGARVVLTDIDEAGLNETAARLGDAVVLARAFDISDRDAVMAFASEVPQQPEIVMNVAGVSTWGSVDRLRPEDWRSMVEINLMGPIHVIEAFIPPLITAGRGGHLVNVSSAAGLFGLPWHAAYSAAKFGLRGVSEVLRFDLHPHGIGVSLVCPGGVDTGLVETMQIVGVDRSHPRMRPMTEDFKKRAVSPEKAAEAILRGVERNRYMVFTSNDIRLLWQVQRRFPPAYNLVMRLLNRRLLKVIGP